MSQGEVPRHIPEDIVESADETSAAETPVVNSERRFDPHRANRELDRWLYGGMNMDSIPRPDQRGTSDTYERLPSLPPLPANWKEGATLIGTTFYTEVRDESGNIIDITERWEPANNPQTENSSLESDE